MSRLSEAQAFMTELQRDIPLAAFRQLEAVAWDGQSLTLKAPLQPNINDKSTAFAGALKGRGLAFVDDGSAARKAGGIPRASASRIIDEELSNTAIDEQLLALEASALQGGQALGSGFAYPVTLNQVAAWAQSVESRGYQLAPASASAGVETRAAKP